jgi:hypothetical protein
MAPRVTTRTIRDLAPWRIEGLMCADLVVAAGWTCRAVAEAMGYSPASVAQMVRRHYPGFKHAKNTHKCASYRFTPYRLSKN